MKQAKIRLTSNQSNKLNWGNKIRVVRNGQVYYIENTKWGVYVTDMGGVPYENVKVVSYWGNELSGRVSFEKYKNE